MTDETSTAKGDIFETAIEKLVTGGAGLGRTPDGMAAFIPGTITGERVRARVTQCRRGFVQAELEEILEASPDRIDPPLGETGTASGCDLQHMSDEAQHRAKVEIVRDCFKRLGRMDLEDRLSGPEPAGPSLGYRNKVRMWRGPTGQYGMRRKGGHEVLTIERHGLMPDTFNDDVMPFLLTLPPVDEMVVRLDGNGGFLVSLFGPSNRLKIMKSVIGALPKDQPPHPGCMGILFNNRPVWGRDHLLMKVAGHTYRVNAGSFFQVNTAEAEAAVDLARVWLDEAGLTAATPGGTLVDLYCGVGLFSLALGERFSNVVGVESDVRAIRDALNNTGRDKATSGKTSIVPAKTEAVLKRWREGDWRDGAIHYPAPDWSQAVAVVDPPRTGLDDNGAENLAAHAPQRILYMSCDPATLARDCRTFCANGYELKRARVIDMFPQTGHVECLVELERS